ncbi:hypothetical protein ACFQZ0_24370 [Streptomyces erythrogriseus]
MTDTAAEAQPRVGSASRVALHELSMRRDRDEWIVGRMATRTFVALPSAGARAVRLLGEGLSVARTQERLRADTGEEFDIADFVADLAALGFVARIDDRPLPDPTPPRASLPWLRPVMSGSPCTRCSPSPSPSCWRSPSSSCCSAPACCPATATCCGARTAVWCC